MKPVTINELKKELSAVPPAKLLELCIRLAKHKKENKELLTYLLFESQDEEGYVATVKGEIDEQFGAINHSNLHFVRKSLRKILRIANKHIRYIGSKQAEVELLLYFCNELINSPIPIHKSTAISNLYQFQLKKIEKVIATLHEDLQYDFLKELKTLEEPGVGGRGSFFSLFLKKK